MASIPAILKRPAFGFPHTVAPLWSGSVEALLQRVERDRPRVARAAALTRAALPHPTPVQAR